jgi:cytochrome P450
LIVAGHRRQFWPDGSGFAVVPTRNIRAKLSAAAGKVIYRIIANRRACGGSGDLLSLLLQAQDDDGSHMSDRQLRDGHPTFWQARNDGEYAFMDMVAAGANPAVERKFHEELDGVLGGSVPTLEDCRSCLI